MNAAGIRQRSLEEVKGLDSVERLRVERDVDSDPVKLIVPNQPTVKRTKLHTKTDALTLGVATSTGAAGMLRFRLERGDVTGGTGAFEEALKNFQNVCERYPPGGEYVPKPIIEARAEYLHAAELHFKAMGIKATNNGRTLEIEPDMKTDLGRYASRAKKYGAAKVDLDPLMKWYSPKTKAAFAVGRQTIHISLDAARTGKTGVSERHEFIHAVFEHYCRDLGGNSALHGDIRASKGVDLFPNNQGCYNKSFSLEENVTYAYEVWWAGREVKGLRDQLERGEVDDLDQFAADMKASFRELFARELSDPGQRISSKTFQVGARLKKLLRENERQLPTASFSKDGTWAYLDYRGNGSGPLGLDFHLVPTRTGEEVLRATCRNTREGVSMEVQVTDPDAIRAVSNVLKSGDQREAARILGIVARDYVRPRITMTTDAANDLCKAHDGLYSALKDADSLMNDLSPQALADADHREQLFGSLDDVFASNRTLRARFRKHSRA